MAGESCFNVDLLRLMLESIPAAGIIRDKPFMEHTPEDLRDTIDINLNGVFTTVQLCAAQMIKQGTGGKSSGEVSKYE